MSIDQKISLLDIDFKQISTSRQCELLGLNRSSLYYVPVGESDMNLAIMRALDQQYTKCPFYGVLRMLEFIKSIGYDVNVKRIRRLLRLMNLCAIYPKPKTSLANIEHKKYPYLLKGLNINKSNYVWSTDITYIVMEKGFLYLVAVIDWYSRFVLSWRLSNTLDANFCVEALNKALESGKPEIFNTDQGVQFTSLDFTNCLLNSNIKISMDGRGRYLDNIFVERLWRTVKQEYVYINAFNDGKELWNGLNDYFHFYNYERLHQSLGYKTPAQIHQLR